jgi:hypothetical protein
MAIFTPSKISLLAPKAQNRIGSPYDTNLCPSWQTERQKDYARDQFTMRYGDKKLYRYTFTNPPKALLKARLDNIAIVPASMLGLKALWQTAANTLPQGGVLLCHSQQNTRQRKLLERIGETFRQQGHAVMNLPVEQVAYR